jgi:hypothetical protein
MRLYVRHMPATPKYMKRAKVRGYASDELLLNCAFFDICDSIVRDLRLPGRVDLRNYQSVNYTTLSFL